MCDSGGCLDDESDAEQGGVRPEANDPRWRDLKRRVGDVARKYAERKYAGAARPSIWVKVRLRRNAGEATGEYPLTCASSCECSVEGPPAEQGDRSHADGVVSLLEDLGIREFEAEVVLCRDERPPFSGYKIYRLTFQEVSL